MPAEIRPTQDLVRKAVFDVLGHRLSEIDFLDLFAGSGAVGLEAISLGAKKVIFVERDPNCVKVIEDNLARLNVRPFEDKDYSYDIINLDVFVALRRLGENKKKFSIIFLDAPYDAELSKKALKSVIDHDIVHANSTIVVQHDAREILPSKEGRFSVVRAKRYGKTKLTMYQEVN